MAQPQDRSIELIAKLKNAAAAFKQLKDAALATTKLAGDNRQLYNRALTAHVSFAQLELTAVNLYTIIQVGGIAGLWTRDSKPITEVPTDGE
jgi:hypothetical protein